MNTTRTSYTVDMNSNIFDLLECLITFYEVSTLSFKVKDIAEIKNIPASVKFVREPNNLAIVV